MSTEAGENPPEKDADEGMFPDSSEFEAVAEEHASKIVALWELGVDFAGGDAEEDDDAGKWSADAPSDADEAQAPAAGEAAQAAAGESPAPGEAKAQEEAPAARPPFEADTDETAVQPPPEAAAPTPEQPAPAAAGSEHDPTVVDAPKLDMQVPEEQPVRPAAAAAAPTAPPMATPAADAVELPQSSSAKYFLFAGAAVLLLAVGGLAYAFLGGDEDPDEADTTAAAAPTQTPDEAPEVTEPTPAEQTEPPEPAAPSEPVAEATEATEAEPAEPEVVEEPAEPPPPTTAALVVRTTPPSATLTLDGETVANPYDGQVEIGSSHRLVAELDGYRAARQSVRVNRDRELTLTLRRAPQQTASTGRRSGRRGRRGASSGRSRRGRGRRGGGRSGGGRSGGRGGGTFVSESPY